VFALTLEPKFFEKLGFSTVERGDLPMKVWSDCARCPKQQECDEVAVAKTLEGTPQAATGTGSSNLSLLE
jgi:amino-acid N-acetyltransferase